VISKANKCPCPSGEAYTRTGIIQIMHPTFALRQVAQCLSGIIFLGMKILILKYLIQVYLHILGPYDKYTRQE